MKSLWKRDVFLRFSLWRYVFRNLSCFWPQSLHKRLRFSWKYFSQIRRCGRISFTSKEDSDLSGFSEIRCRIWWFLYPKITIFLISALKHKGHGSPEIPLKSYPFGPIGDPCGSIGEPSGNIGVPLGSIGVPFGSIEDSLWPVGDPFASVGDPRGPIGGSRWARSPPTLPYIGNPDIATPYVVIPYIEIPYLDISSIEIPYIEIPYVEIPYIDIPCVDFPYPHFTHKQFVETPTSKQLPTNIYNRKPTSTCTNLQTITYKQWHIQTGTYKQTPTN